MDSLNPSCPIAGLHLKEIPSLSEQSNWKCCGERNFPHSLWLKIYYQLKWNQEEGLGQSGCAEWHRTTVQPPEVMPLGRGWLVCTRRRCVRRDCNHVAESHVQFFTPAASGRVTVGAQCSPTWKWRQGRSLTILQPGPLWLVRLCLYLPEFRAVTQVNTGSLMCFIFPSKVAWI